MSRASEILKKQVALTDSVGDELLLITAGGKPRISSTSYLQDVAEGLILNHSVYTKLGYSPSLSGNTLTDVWDYSGAQAIYIFPTTEMGMEVLSSDNTNDIATVIHSGTSNGGSVTTLEDSTATFTTTTAVGDIVILDKSGTVPEYGYITAIDSDTKITVSGGFSSGGTGNGRSYSIIDKSANSGALAVKIGYLDSDYIEHEEIVLMNGTTVVATTNTDIFRVNSFKVIATGALGRSAGNISLRDISDTPIYAYIRTGTTLSRNSMYTVPAGKVLYVTDIAIGFAVSGTPNAEYAVITTRANIDPVTKFRTDGIFHPLSDIVCHNATVPIQLQMPTILPEKTDFKITVIASVSGATSTVLRGVLKNE